MSFGDKLAYIWETRGLLLESLGLSLLIAFGAVVIGFIIGVLLAVIRIAPKNNPVIRVLDWIAQLYITVIRGTPFSERTASGSLPQEETAASAASVSNMMIDRKTVLFTFFCHTALSKKSRSCAMGIGFEYLYPCRYEADICLQRSSSF